MLIPPLALIFLVLGTIFLGIATPTEGGAMGAVGALIMAGAKGRLTLDVIKQALASTTRLSSFVLFILIGARVFSLTFYGVNGHLWVEHLLVSLPGGEVGFLIGVNLLVFVLAFFLDFFELAFIIVPLLAPAADKLGIDLIWFGVLLGVNMQTSFMHPPFGFALFYLRSVAARVPYLDRITGKQIAPVTTGQIYWGAVPFVVHPGRHGRVDDRLPANGHALQGRQRRPGDDRDHDPPGSTEPGLGLPPLGEPPAGGGVQPGLGPPPLGDRPRPIFPSRRVSTEAGRRCTSWKQHCRKAVLLHRHADLLPRRPNRNPGATAPGFRSPRDQSLPLRCCIIMKVS